MAVVFAMLASYLLSRTLIPTMVHHLLRTEAVVYQTGGHGGKGIFWSVHRGANSLFERLRYRYTGLLDFSLRHRGPVLIAFLLVSFGSLWLATMVGHDFFPEVDAGQLRLHARSAPGTRIEQTEFRFADVEQEIRAALPAGEVETILENIGVPNAWGSIAQGDVPNIAATDGEIMISLNRDKHGPVRDYEVLLRKRLEQRFPDMVFFFEPANITNQILNFGLPALQARAKAQGPHRADPWRGGRSHPSGVPSAATERERGPRQGGTIRVDAARRQQQHADFA
jgi:multidrug efflux pump subunit AcrB